MTTQAHVQGACRGLDGDRALLRRMLAGIVQGGRLTSDAGPIVLASCVAGTTAHGAVDPTFLLALVDELRAAIPGVRLTLACGRADPSVRGGLADCGGLLDLTSQEGLDVVDLIRSPAYSVSSPSFPYTVRVPLLAFTPHTLLTVASLATDPIDGISGMLSTQLSLFPDLVQPEMWPFRREAVQLALRLWPPDLCILDARRVVLHTETWLGCSVDVHAMGCLLAGHDPCAVDRRAAQLLKLPRRQVTLLRHRGRNEPPDLEDILDAGQAVPLAARLARSPYTIPHRLIETAFRVHRRMDWTAGRCVEGLGLARLIDFVRRCREVSC